MSTAARSPSTNWSGIYPFSKYQLIYNEKWEIKKGVLFARPFLSYAWSLIKQCL